MAISFLDMIFSLNELYARKTHLSRDVFPIRDRKISKMMYNAVKGRYLRVANMQTLAHRYERE
jgi:hypothetical protein